MSLKTSTAPLALLLAACAASPALAQLSPPLGLRLTRHLGTGL